MTFDEFVADVKAKAEAAKTEMENFFASHPEIETEASAVVTRAVTDLHTAATADVAKQTLPPEVSDALDLAITTAQEAADAQIASIQSETAAKVASLQAAKAQVSA